MLHLLEHHDNLVMSVSTIADVRSRCDRRCMPDRLVPVVVCLFAAGCVQREAPPNDINASISKCGMDGHIRLHRLGERQFRIEYLDPNSDYAKVDCFLAEAKRLRIDLGFVGNEAYVRD
jgi:hypothetical protein